MVLNCMGERGTKVLAALESPSVSGAVGINALIRLMLCGCLSGYCCLRK